MSDPRTVLRATRQVIIDAMDLIEQTPEELALVAALEALEQVLDKAGEPHK